MFGKEFSVTSTVAGRLLFMGTLFSREYETLDDAEKKTGLAGVQTTAPGVEHNGKRVLTADRLPVGHGLATEPAVNMANETLIQPHPETEATAGLTAGHELDAFLGKAFEEPPIWRTLYENVRDVFFPVRLPPLQLTSTPIPVPDRMAVKANPWAIGISSTLNIAILVFAIWLGIKTVVKIVSPPV